MFPLPISSQTLLISPTTQLHTIFLALEDKQLSKNKHSRTQTKPNQTKIKKKHKNSLHMAAQTHRETSAIPLNMKLGSGCFLCPHTILKHLHSQPQRHLEEQTIICSMDQEIILQTIKPSYKCTV